MHSRYTYTPPPPPPPSPLFPLTLFLLSTSKEADNWTTLSADVDEVFASGDPDQVSCFCGNHVFDNLCMSTDIRQTDQNAAEPGKSYPVSFQSSS